MSKTILKGQAGQATSADVSVADPNATVALTGEHGCDAARPESQQPVNACEEAIRVRAHSKWEAAGCPAGDGFDFWLEAEREVNTERSGSSSAQGARNHAHYGWARLTNHLLPGVETARIRASDLY